MNGEKKKKIDGEEITQSYSLPPEVVEVIGMAVNAVESEYVKELEMLRIKFNNAKRLAHNRMIKAKNALTLPYRC